MVDFHEILILLDELQRSSGICYSGSMNSISSSMHVEPSYGRYVKPLLIFGTIALVAGVISAIAIEIIPITMATFVLTDTLVVALLGSFSVGAGAGIWLREHNVLRTLFSKMLSKH